MACNLTWYLATLFGMRPKSDFWSVTQPIFWHAILANIPFRHVTQNIFWLASPTKFCYATQHRRIEESLNNAKAFFPIQWFCFPNDAICWKGAAIIVCCIIRENYSCESQIFSTYQLGCPQGDKIGRIKAVNVFKCVLIHRTIGRQWHHNPNWISNPDPAKLQVWTYSI